MNIILKDLVEKNYYCMSQIFGYGYLPYSEDRVEGDFAVVMSHDFSNLSQLEEFLNGIYIANEVKRLLYSYFDDMPMYVEIEGKLAVRVDMISSAGMVRPWGNYEIHILDQDLDKCLFEVKVKYDKDDIYIGPDEETYLFCSIKDGEWKLEKMVCHSSRIEYKDESVNMNE